MLELEQKENAIVEELIECIKSNRINSNYVITGNSKKEDVPYYDLSQDIRRTHDDFLKFEENVLKHFGLNNAADSDKNNIIRNITCKLKGSIYGKDSKRNSIAFYFLMNPKKAVKTRFYILDITGVSENQSSGMKSYKYVALPQIYTKDLSRYVDNTTKKIDVKKLSSDPNSLEKHQLEACIAFYDFNKNDVIAIIEEGKIISFFDKIQPYKYLDVLFDGDHKSCHRRYGRWLPMVNPTAVDTSDFKNGIFEEVVDEEMLDTLYLKYVEVTNQIVNTLTHPTKSTTRLKKGTVESKMKTAIPLIGCNKLLYGLPGCGKSYKAKEISGYDDKFVTRVIFHPDYTNADFVGQILPRINKEGKLNYEFVAGPFTKSLKKAFADKTHMYYLIIEELNRGNAPAIFGELFQLLDRLDEDKSQDKKAGASEYSIDNSFMAEYIFGDGEKEIYIPNNLTVIATMNTSDQNVFTLDTAFQRRWEMERIKNEYASYIHKGLVIAKTKILWVDFVKVINSELASSNMSFTSTEDKGIGLYFAKKTEIEDAKRFAEKVLKYLWDDAFKMRKEDLFKLNDEKGNRWDLAAIQEKFANDSKIEDILIGEIVGKMKGSK